MQAHVPRNPYTPDPKIAQLYAQTRKGEITDTFKPTKPWYHGQMGMDLIDFTNKPGRSVVLRFVEMR